jgi:hypothetical protein
MTRLKTKVDPISELCVKYISTLDKNNVQLDISIMAHVITELVFPAIHKKVLCILINFILIVSFFII